MGKINVKAKAKKIIAKVNRIQPLAVPMKAKAKAEKEQLLSTPLSKKVKQRTVLTETATQEDSLPVKESAEKLVFNKTSTEKAKILPKKEKQLQKRKKLMNKFALMKKELEEEAKRKKRAATAVVGDLNPLKDALPSLQELFDLSKKTNELENSSSSSSNKNKNTAEKPAKKLNIKKKIKQKKEKMVRQVKSFEALLKDPDFKKNPRDAISYHIKYKHGLLNE